MKLLQAILIVEGCFLAGILLDSLGLLVLLWFIPLGFLTGRLAAQANA